jgi:hypothetical protein
MSAESLPPNIPPGKPERPFLLSDIEQEALTFSENNRVIEGLTRAIERREDIRRQQLEKWREEATAVPLRGWARDYNIGGASAENLGLQKLPYSDGRKYDRRGGLTPPDRYVIHETHVDRVDGEMVWMGPELNPQQIYYHVLSRSLRFVKDADILRFRQAST